MTKKGSVGGAFSDAASSASKKTAPTKKLKVGFKCCDGCEKDKKADTEFEYGFQI